VQRKDSKKSALSVLIVEWNFDCVLVFCDYNFDDAFMVCCCVDFGRNDRDASVTLCDTSIQKYSYYNWSKSSFQLFC
jgi:hypothetical protein